MNVLDEQIVLACNSSKTMGIASKIVGIPYTTFKRKAIKLGVWKPNCGGKGVPEYILDLVFSGKKKIKTVHLKERLYLDGYKQPKCEECGCSEIWNGKPIVLELDHINGVKDDNRLENLRILCPNCHSQTPTFRRKKK